MPVELMAVAGTALIHFFLLMGQQLYNDVVKGPKWALGNREDQDLDELSKRIQRTIFNHIENTLIFTPLALAVVVGDVSSWTTQTGAMLFFGARVGYALAYVAGIKYLRSGVWTLGVVGYWMVGWPFLSSLWS